METIHLIKPDLAYGKRLVDAGWNGVAAARREFDGRVFAPPLQNVAWTHSAIGASIGMLTTGLTGKRKSASRVAMGGLVGSVLGLGVAVVWASRGFIGRAARKGARHVNVVRDAHWLENHPVDYA